MTAREYSSFDRQQFDRLSTAQIDFIVGRWPAADPPVAVTAEPDFSSGIIFPGAFDPLHDAHKKMAKLAAADMKKPVWFEVSIENVDKPALDFDVATKRASQRFDPHGLVFTRAPSFEKKSQLFAGCVFIVGADTIMRINQPMYYGGDPQWRTRAIEVIAQNRCRFLVFPRKQCKMPIGNANTNPGILLASELKELCQFVPEEGFEMDISSQNIRESR